jgi:hypothetical protein
MANVMYLNRRRTRLIRKRVHGFSLVEVTLSVLALSLFMAACFSSILFNRVASMKAKQEAIAMDFLIHYTESIKGLPFSNVVPGQPINPLYDGADGAPNIRIPNDSSWVRLDTDDFKTFHPDLIWVASQNPKMQVNMESVSQGGVPHDVHLNIRMAWDPPLGRNGKLQAQVDLVRIKDL